MLHLIQPCSDYLPSYIEAYDEYATHGIDSYAFGNAREIDVLAKFEDYRLERNLKPNRVGADYYWLVDDASLRFLGEITIRHRLTSELERYAGHIGYGVRYSEWGKGHGTLMLRLALDKAKAMGLARVLGTCDDDNLGSARVMEKCGFVLHDKIENSIDGQTVITRRYWKTL